MHASASLISLKKRILHFGRLYFIWELIYFPICIYMYSLNGKGLIFNSIDYIRKFLFVGSNYYSYQFWFLLAMIYMLIMLYFLLKLKVSATGILVISIISNIIGNLINYLIVTDSASGILSVALRYFISLFGESSILKNFIYIGLGFFIAEYEIIISAKCGVILGIVGFAGKCLLPRPWCEFIYPLEIMVFFQLFVQLQLGENSLLFKNLRKYSIVLYYSHLYFFFLYCFTQEKFPGYGLKAFIVCLVCGLALGRVVIYLGCWPKYQWINNIFA